MGEMTSQQIRKNLTEQFPDWDEVLIEATVQWSEEFMQAEKRLGRPFSDEEKEMYLATNPMPSQRAMYSFLNTFAEKIYQATDDARRQEGQEEIERLATEGGNETNSASAALPVVIVAVIAVVMLIIFGR